VELQHLKHGVMGSHDASAHAAMHDFALKAICDSTRDIDEKDLSMN